MVERVVAAVARGQLSVALPGLPKGRTPVAAAVERIIKAGLDEGLLSLSSSTLAHMENPYRDNKRQ